MKPSLPALVLLPAPLLAPVCFAGDRILEAKLAALEAATKSRKAPVTTPGC